VSDWRRRAVRRLADAGVPDPHADVRRLFEAAYAIGALAPEPQSRDAPNDLTLEMLDRYLGQRLRRRPVAQILGHRDFWRHRFEVTGEVLDPRPDTELLVELGLAEPFRRVLDLGTGTGCILISLLGDRPAAEGLGTDLSEAALAVAGRNAVGLGVAPRAEFRRSDWFGAVTGRFDLIVSNPPYIGLDEMAGLAPEVRDWEPRMALTDGGDGLSAYRAILAGVERHLLPGGRLIVEIGWRQGDAVSALFRAAGLDAAAVHADLEGRERAVFGRKP
jgi:release factor glutamine methyltransferase